MQNRLRALPLVWAVLIAVGTVAGLLAAFRRFHVEARNRRVEIALEWSEISNLAQMNPQHMPLREVLNQFKAQGVSTLVLNEETLATLDQTGATRPARVPAAHGGLGTLVEVDNAATLQRIRTALQVRGLLPLGGGQATSVPVGGTLFALVDKATGRTLEGVAVPVEYANLRTLGLGLNPDAVAATRAAHLYIAGRISNFPGVTPTTAANVLRNLSAQGTSTVIFVGDDVLGYRGLEPEVAALLRHPAPGEASASAGVAPIPLTYGAVEFSKQNGDDKLTAALHGDYVRVHAVQAAEMAQLDENEAIERFVRAARERNIRFCFVRLLTMAGADPVAANVEYVKKIAEGIQRNSAVTGGAFEFGEAHPFEETHLPAVLFALVALGAAAGTVWMLRLFCPLPPRSQALLLIGLCVICAGLAADAGEMGRKLVALLAGIVFPTAACLRVFPRSGSAFALVSGDDPSAFDRNQKRLCLVAALRGLGLASAITALGILQVIGLLATRPFMLHASQFLGIKAQHAIPVVLVAVAALLGGAAAPRESWDHYRRRVTERLRALWNEPVRFGLLVLGVAALAALALVVARTGNDPGVGVSGFEMKVRAVLDRVLPVRPRTKEFLIGHPALLLGLAWWWRGRRKLALPFFVVGSLGQVSLLNTFCHIHTPLLLSIWRDGIGLVLGALIGAALFILAEFFFPPPSDEASVTTREARPVVRETVPETMTT